MTLPAIERISGWWCACSCHLIPQAARAARAMGRGDDCCKRRSKYRVDGQPMCRRHAAEKVLDTLVPPDPPRPKRRYRKRVRG